MNSKSLTHTKWKCQYHIVFIPKYRKKKLFGQMKRNVREILSTLCKYKGVGIIEDAVYVDHVHMCVSMPPKISISNFMGYLKGKSTLMIYDRHPEQQSKWNKAFWARGYYVATVGNVTEPLGAFFPPLEVGGDFALIVLLYGTAARLDKALSLQAENLYLEGTCSHATIIGKGAKARTLYLLKDAAEYMKKYKNEFFPSGSSDGYFLYSRNGGKTVKLSQTAVQKALHKYARTAQAECKGVPSGLHAHQFCHARASHWLDEGINIVLDMRAWRSQCVTLTFRLRWRRKHWKQSKMKLTKQQYPNGKTPMEP